MILTGFISDFKTHNKREPNQEEMIEVSKVLFKRTEELSEAVFKSRYVNRKRLNLWEPNEQESSLWPSCGVIEWFSAH